MHQSPSFYRSRYATLRQSISPVDAPDDHLTNQGSLLPLFESVDIEKEFPITSHRRRIGFLIVLAKKFIVKIFRPVLRITMQRQVLVNEYVAVMALQIDELQNRLAVLEQALGKKP